MEQIKIDENVDMTPMKGLASSKTSHHPEKTPLEEATVLICPFPLKPLSCWSFLRLSQ